MTRLRRPLMVVVALAVMTITPTVANAATDEVHDDTQVATDRTVDRETDAVADRDRDRVHDRRWLRRCQRWVLANTDLRPRDSLRWWIRVCRRVWWHHTHSDSPT